MLDDGDKCLSNVYIISTTRQIKSTNKYRRDQIILATVRINNFLYTVVINLNNNSLSKNVEFRNDNLVILKISNSMICKAKFRVQKLK